MSVVILQSCSTTIDPGEPDRPEVAAECTVDFECDPGAVCIAELCVIEAAPPGGCTVRADCGPGEVCAEGVCDGPPAACAHSEECPDDLLCDGFSGNCFDPNAAGCTTDNDCRFEVGCEDGCLCLTNSCVVDDNPPDPPAGDPIDLDGYSVENHEHDPPIQVGVLSDISLNPGQVLVIGRDATRSEFEAGWNITLPANTIYFNNASRNGGVPVINGDESFALVSPVGTVIDGDNNVGGVGHSYHRNAALGWDELGDDEATPGSTDLPTTGVGLVISEWSDASGAGRFPFEFVELYYAP